MDDFLYLNYFQEKIILWKRGALQLSSATNFSSIRQKTAKLQEFKLEQLGDLSRSPWERANLTAPSGLLFHPDKQRFICMHSDRRSTKADLLLSPFRSPRAPCAVLVCFVRTHDEGAMYSKITIGAMLPELLKWANSVGSSCFPPTPG